MDKLTVLQFGDSAGVILPRELLDHLGVGVGQALSVSKVRGGIELRANGADVDAQKALAREVMSRRRRALHRLAD